MKTLKRRRKENKTDYLKRMKLLKGRTPRIVFRKTNKFIISQYVESKEAQDNVKIEVNSKHLIKHGWPKELKGSLKSLSASYLTGLAIGKKIVEKKLKNPIIDSGLHRTLHKTRFYAFIKGLIDSGIKISCEEKLFPSEEKIQGKHKKDFPFEQIKSNINKK